jgi:putative Na+/H+ antiporter
LAGKKPDLFVRFDRNGAVAVEFYFVEPIAGGKLVHGRIEQWWIEPVLSSLSEWPLMIGAMLLTALNNK